MMHHPSSLLTDDVLRVAFVASPHRGGAIGPPFPLGRMGISYQRVVPAWQFPKF
jgi:hypothetical protein